jgi:hypothetical protein
VFDRHQGYRITTNGDEVKMFIVFQCKKTDNGWHCLDMGLRFAVFEDSGHLGDTGREVLSSIHNHVNNVEDIYRTRGFNSLYG